MLFLRVMTIIRMEAGVQKTFIYFLGTMRTGRPFGDKMLNLAISPKPITDVGYASIFFPFCANSDSIA